MDPFDVTSDARESKCEPSEEDSSVSLIPPIQGEEIVPYHKRNPAWHDEARFIVAHHAGEIMQAWTIREALHKARCTTAAYAVVFERHRFVAKIRRM